MSFKTVFDQYSWQQIQERIYKTTTEDVAVSLAKKHRDLQDFIHLISPAAQRFLEPMAQQSQILTQKRFGKTMSLYAPVYLSNECQNICTYCGFSLDNKIPRKTLNPMEIQSEILALKDQGYDHVLLVTGEANYTVNLQYFKKAISIINQHFSTISIEVQPLSLSEYEQLQQHGVHAVLVYQETYHKQAYKTYHPKGKKSNFEYRLDTPDRIGKAGIHKIGLGVLLGLEDWRVDSFFNALHISYLQKTYWQTKYSVSFPRLRPAQGVLDPVCTMDDKDLVQLICAYRIWNPELEISISTRESQKFRDHIITLGATSISAGSKTSPGGYSVDQNALEQFEISDTRSTASFIQQIHAQGYDPVFKDWDHAYKNAPL